MAELLGKGLTPEEAEALVQDKTLMVKVLVRGPDFTKKIRKTREQISVGDVGDRNRFGHDKNILTGPEVDALRSQRGRIGKYMNSVALKSELSLSWHLIALASFPKVRDRIKAYEAERALLVAEFEAHYLDRIREAQKALGPHYDANDYPKVSELKEAFRVEFEPRSTLDVPANLEMIDLAFALELREQARANCPQMIETIEAGIIELLHQMTTHLAARLGTDEAGKSRRLYDSAVGDLKLFLADCRDMNVSGRGDIDALATKAALLLDGVSMSDLRKDKSLKETVRVGMNEVARALDPLVAKGPIRKFQPFDQ